MSSPKRMRAKSIGHYILGKTIGEGTFGKVKLGTHILTGEKVAVKILEKERIVDVADVERVAREIHILKLIQHPHVIQLYEIIETPRQLYLIMEYCSGGELFDHIVANGRIREREACRFFHQIIAGVEQIHRMSVVHRDLKPENLLLDEHRSIKIVDFGLSNTFQEGQLLKTACGSPCYAAPEMIAGQRYVPSRCDLWSCGVILFALVCGYLPFEDQNTAALYRKILNADYQAPKFISESVRDLIAKMLTTDPEQRYTVPRIRAHSWYRQLAEGSTRYDSERGERQLEEDVLEQLDRFGFPRDYAVKCLQMNKHNHVTTTYHLLVDKKRRMADRLLANPQDVAMGDLSAGGLQQNGSAQAGGGQQGGMEVELLAQCSSPDSTQGDAADQAVMPKLSLEPPHSTPADADRAGGGGGSPAPPSARQVKTPDATPGAGPNYGNWAQALGLPDDTAREVMSARGPGDSSARGDPPGSAPTPGTNFQPVPAGPPGSARASAGSARRHSDNHNGTPRNGIPPSGQGASGSAPSGAAQPTPRKRSPIQQTMGFATPRGPVLTPPPLCQSATPSRAGTYGSRGDVPTSSTPTGRTSTPGKRLPPGTSSTSAGGDSQSARGSSSTRPSTSQGIATPSRPAGSATARSSHANEARRRHYAAANGSSDGGPGSARTNRASTTAGSGAAAAAALAADLATGPGPTGRGAGGGNAGPASAWAARPPVSGGGARASSASPEICATPGDERGGGSSATAPAGNGGSSGAAAGSSAVGSGAMSAREARDEVMRTCRGAFNVSCTSSKAPKQILQEMQRALTLQRVSYKQASAFLVKCQRQNLRFEMEISHLDHLESIYVVRFRRVAGELVSYKELCSKILAEMKI
mmetsp:Transcript_89718/g.155277  ORF Transcript_89718/g.155277 Transcript_89718/m.155277 type:complete len:869 (-) Transcript_89718:114-2720(-)